MPKSSLIPYFADFRTSALADAAVKGSAEGGFGSDPSPTSFVEGSRSGIIRYSYANLQVLVALLWSSYQQHP